MGQHKTNLTAIKAKNGEIPPKPPTMSRTEFKRQLQAACHAVLSSPFTEYVNQQAEIADVMSRMANGVPEHIKYKYECLKQAGYFDNE